MLMQNAKFRIHSESPIHCGRAASEGATLYPLPAFIFPNLENTAFTPIKRM